MFSESKFWLSIGLVFIYLVIADLYVDYIISRELDSMLQLMATFAFLALTFYSIKGVVLLWTKKSVKQSKKEKK